MTSHPIFPPAATVRRGAVVLVHGAWVGEWCWQPIVDRLRARGLTTHAVSLTGHGTRRHEGGPHVTLSDHVDDLAAVLDIYDLVETTVVAHSYGGRVVTKAWPRIAARTKRLVYVDAHAPLGPSERRRRDDWCGDAEPSGMVPMGAHGPSADVLGGDDALSWFTARTAPQSQATLAEPFWTDLPSDLAKTYVRATANHDGRFDAYAEDAARRSDWDYVEIPGDHWLIYSHADAIADVIAHHDHRHDRRSRPEETTT